MTTAKITAPDHLALDELCDRLAELAPGLEEIDAWPGEQLLLCGEYGVYEWFLEPEHGGQGWDEADIVRGYLRLSAACLTTTFVITQRTGACNRIAAGESDEAKERLLPDLVSGASFATVGISHLTTSRRHLKTPVLRATPQGEGFVLDGFSPWVTGGDRAETIVVGATLEDGREILAALPTDLAGVVCPPPARLVGLTASRTGKVECEGVAIGPEQVLAGPVENVMQQGVGAKTGGLQTSTLAIGLADAAISFVEAESEKRPNLIGPMDALRTEHRRLEEDLLAAAEGEPPCSNEQLRTRANSLALRAAQSSLAAAKGTGYVLGHPAGRWCREALFFLVWSCPQPVMSANLCELAGIEG